MSSGKPRVLVVEDEAPIRSFLRMALDAHGYAYAEAGTLREASVQVTAQPPDVLILDLGLPDGDGMQFIRSVREWSRLPIVVLSARGNEVDKVAALDAGADDYLTKPFGVPELLARLRVALRHAARGDAGTGDAPVVWRADDGSGFELDVGQRAVWRLGPSTRVEVRLTPKQFALLAVLAKHAGKVLTHAQLLRDVWGPAHEADVAYLRVYMGQLRHQLETVPADPRWLLTEPGVGYRLAAPTT